MKPRISLVFPALLALPATLPASEEGGLSGIISIAPGSMLWTILTFLILLVILWKFAWGPIVRGLEAREEKIHGAIEKAQTDREEAAKRLSEYEEKLKSASAEISERLANADREAGHRIDEAREKAREEGEKLIERAKREIEAEQVRVSAELRREVADLAAKIAAAAISESFDKDDQLRIIKRRLEQVEKES